MNSEKILTARELLERVYSFFRDRGPAVIIFQESTRSSRDFLYKEVVVFTINGRELAVSLGVKSHWPSAQIAVMPIEEKHGIVTGIEKLIYRLKNEALYFLRTGQYGQGLYSGGDMIERLKRILKYNEVRVCSECTRELDDTMSQSCKYEIKYAENVAEAVFWEFCQNIGEQMKNK